MPANFESMFLSELADDVNPAEVARIVRASRANNAAEALSGVLMFDGSNFCQYLEGPEQPVRDRMAKIAVDPRHTRFQPLHQDFSGVQRRFEAWHVGILAPDGASPLLAFRSLRGPAAVDHLEAIFRDSHTLGIHVI